MQRALSVVALGLGLAALSSGPALAMPPELVFHRYGRTEFLHAIHLPEGTGTVLEASRSEVEAARVLASEHAAHGSAGKVSP